MKRLALAALLMLFTVAVQAQEEFGRPIGEDDAPVGGPAVDGAAVGQEEDDAAVGGRRHAVLITAETQRLRVSAPQR